MSCQCKSSFKVGDTVVVTHKVTQREDGWDNSWVREMDKVIDKQDTIVAIGDGGIQLKNNGFRFPPSSLKLVPKPHVHAEVIKAWADGAEIEFKIVDDQPWCPAGKGLLSWHEHYKYRVKPEPKPDCRVPLQLLRLEGGGFVLGNDKDNFIATFDGETGKLKAVELI